MSGTSPRFNSITTRMPDLSDSVAQIGDPFNFLFPYQLADLDEQIGFSPW
jgi:hypothetical protein